MYICLHNAYCAKATEWKSLDASMNSHVQDFILKFQKHRDIAVDKGQDVNRISCTCSLSDESIAGFSEAGSWSWHQATAMPLNQPISWRLLLITVNHWVDSSPVTSSQCTIRNLVISNVHV